MTPDVDIIIVSYNTRDVLAACLESIHASLPRGLRQIFVVDNASTDGSVDHVRANWPQIRVIALEKNIGFGAANNIALREAQAGLVLLLNSDTIVPSGAIDALVDRLEVTGAAAAGPYLTNDTGLPEISFGAMLSPFAELRQLVQGRLAASRRPFARRYVERLLSVEHEVDWVSGACLLVRREAAIRAGLFDERYFMYEEDVDFCAALRKDGGRVLFTPRSRIIHIRGGSREGASANSKAAYDRSHLAFYEKHRPGWLPLLRLSQRLRGRGIR